MSLTIDFSLVAPLIFFARFILLYQWCSRSFSSLGELCYLTTAIEKLLCATNGVIKPSLFRSTLLGICMKAFECLRLCERSPCSFLVAFLEESTLGLLTGMTP